MLFGKLISLFLVTAILNPICCCNAELLAEAQPIESQHDCCPSDDAGERESPCENEDDCPLKPESLSQKAQQADLKNIGPQEPLHPGFLCHWLGLGVRDGLANARHAIREPVPHLGNDSPPPLRLHEAKCVYLI